jgi:hypothetical protein
MGLLRNSRHEVFARAIADGHSATQAHGIAGFSADRANAGRLRHRDDISRRVDEILTARTRAADKALVSAAARVGVDEAWILRNLKRNVILAMRAGDRSAAARSLELLGKHLNLFVDRKSIEINYVDDDSDQYLVRLMQLVDAKTVEHEPAPLVIDHEAAEP